MSCAEESDDHWTYGDTSEWAKHFPSARGLSQSPIDIKTDSTVIQMYSPFLFSGKYDSDEVFTLTNNGHQVAATLAKNISGQSPTDLWFTGGGLTGTFSFINFHLHWGRSDRHGSEHEIDGYKFAAEAHFVFKNYQNGQTAVFAFLFTIADESNNENTEWEKYANAASRLVNIKDTINYTFDLSQLMQVNDTQFFRYIGSLTTPPCTEGVIWTVFSTEIPITEKSLNLLRQNVMRKVYRPVQPINGRTIFRNSEY